MYPTLLAFCNEMSATLARLLAYVGAIVVLGLVAARMCGLPRVEAAVEPLAPRSWITIERPHRAFALILPELPGEPEPSYAIQRHPAGGGRKDTMSWGEAQSAGSRLLIEIYRPGSELKRFADPVSEILARAAELGAIRSPKPVAALDSKLGPVALVDFTARRDERARHCLGFARSFEDPRLQIAGWYCKGDDEIVDGRLIACAVDRLTVNNTLVPSGRPGLPGVDRRFRSIGGISRRPFRPIRNEYSEDRESVMLALAKKLGIALILGPRFGFQGEHGPRSHECVFRRNRPRPRGVRGGNQTWLDPPSVHRCPADTRERDFPRAGD